MQLRKLALLVLLVFSITFAVSRLDIHHDKNWIWAAYIYPEGADFKGQKIAATATALDFEDFTASKLYAGMPNTYFSADFFACLDISDDHAVKIDVTSDDGAWVFIDSKLVVDNGGMHSRKSTSAVTGVKQGLHLVNVRYTQGQAQAVLKVKITEEDTRRELTHRLRRPLVEQEKITCPS